MSLAACVEKDKVPSGAEDFATFCSACHGAGGKGDGDAAATLDRKPADLTGLSARNGGAFPGTRVMAKIWGYTGGHDGKSPMPQFGPLLQASWCPMTAATGCDADAWWRLDRTRNHPGTLQDREALRPAFGMSGYGDQVSGPDGCPFPCGEDRDEQAS